MKSLRRYLLVVFLSLTGAAFAEPRTPENEALYNALLDDNEGVIKAYLDKGGDPNHEIEKDKDMPVGYTLLYYTAVWNRHSIMSLLLKRGADPRLMAPYHQYPIQISISNKDETGIKILTIPSQEIDAKTVREDLVLRLVRESYLAGKPEDGKKPRDPTYVRVNDGDPTESEMKKLQALGAHLKPFSQAPFDPNKDLTRLGQTKVTKLEITMNYDAAKKSAGWRFRISSGPLSGGGAEGVCAYKYGYWLMETTSSWDE